MLKKRTRRLLAIVILMISGSPLEPLIKLLIAGPLLVLLLIEWDEFKWSESKKLKDAIV